MNTTNFIDLTGLKQHKLTVLYRDGYNNDKSRVMWMCECECGSRVRILGHSIKRGQKSCKECSKAAIKHNLSHLSEYNVWKNMVSRCTHTSSVSYFRYGGRGIKVCERWLNSFENFLADMGLRPTSTHTIERINNDGDYEPTNCKWATRKEQARNYRWNRILEYNGEKHCVSEWAEILSVTHDAIHSKLRRGKTVEQALTFHPKKEPILYEYKGESLVLSKWDERLGLSHGALLQRLKSGMPFLEAIKKGKGNGGYTHKKTNA